MATAKDSAITRPTKTRLTKRQSDAVINQALQILEKRLNRAGTAITSPWDTKAWLRLNLAGYEREIFAVMFLDTRHRMLAFEEMFLGTIDQASVYPREVVKAALHHNASAVIVAHNHPSGVAEPSLADISITEQLRGALATVGVKLLDHCVVGSGEAVSLEELKQAKAMKEEEERIRREKEARAARKRRRAKAATA